MKKIKIVLIDGAIRKESSTRKLVFETAARFDRERTNVTIIDQSVIKLPLYDDNPELQSDAEVQHLLSSVASADVVVLSSPEYHGSMSGALKNVLDWCAHVQGEFAGKVVGIIGGGASLANSGANIQMMMATRAMHGWLIPDILVSVTNIWDAFDSNGTILDAKLKTRLEQFTQKLTRYGELFRDHRDVFIANS